MGLGWGWRSLLVGHMLWPGHLVGAMECREGRRVVWFTAACRRQPSTRHEARGTFIHKCGVSTARCYEW